MKIVLIGLTVIAMLGLVSSIYLSGSVASGIQDSLLGLAILGGLWAAWFIFRKKKLS
jgi:hypothetical protein